MPLKSTPLALSALFSIVSTIVRPRDEVQVVKHRPFGFIATIATSAKIGRQDQDKLVRMLARLFVGVE